MQRTEARILCRHLGKGPWYGETGLTTEEERGVSKSGYLHWVWMGTAIVMIAGIWIYVVMLRC